MFKLVGGCSGLSSQELKKIAQCLAVDNTSLSSTIDNTTDLHLVNAIRRALELPHKPSGLTKDELSKLVEAMGGVSAGKKSCTDLVKEVQARIDACSTHYRTKRDAKALQDLYVSRAYPTSNYGLLPHGVYFQYAVPADSTPHNPKDKRVASGVPLIDVERALTEDNGRSSCATIGYARTPKETLFKPDRKTAKVECEKLYDSLFKSHKSPPNRESWIDSCMLREGCQGPKMKRYLRPYTSEFFPRALNPVPMCCKRSLRAVVKVGLTLERLRELTGAMSVDEARKTLASTRLPSDVQKAMVESARRGDEDLQALASSWGNVDNFFLDFLFAFVRRVKNAIVAAFRWLFAQRPQDLASSKKPGRLQSLLLSIASVFSYFAKSGFNVAMWIISHPKIALFLSTWALTIYRKLCRAMSLKCTADERCRKYFGLAQQRTLKRSTGAALKDSVTEFVKENWDWVETAVISAIHSFVSGGGFESTLGWVGSAMQGTITAVFAPIPGLNLLAGVGAGAVWGFAKSAAAEAASDIAIGMVLGKIGDRFVTALTMKCIAQPPPTIVVDTGRITGEDRAACVTDGDCSNEQAFKTCASDGFCYTEKDPPTLSGSFATGASAAAASTKDAAYSAYASFTSLLPGLSGNISDESTSEGEGTPDEPEGLGALPPPETGSGGGMFGSWFGAEDFSTSFSKPATFNRAI